MRDTIYVVRPNYTAHTKKAKSEATGNCHFSVAFQDVDICRLFSTYVEEYRFEFLKLPKYRDISPCDM